jgi:hypothetical protein
MPRVERADAAEYVAPQQGMSVVGRALTLLALPAVGAGVAVTYQIDPYPLRLLSSGLSLIPCGLWVVAALLGPSRWTNWFFRPRGRIAFDNAGVHWDRHRGRPVNVKWADITKVSRSGWSIGIIEPDLTWVSVPMDFWRVQTPDGQDEYTFAMALVRSQPDRFVLDASRGDPPEQARQRQAGQPASDTTPLVPLRRFGYRPIAALAVSIFIASLLEVFVHG